MSPAIPAVPTARPWYRHRWPWFIMLGPMAVMVATFVTVVLAVRQPDAVVVDDYYKQGKAINQDLRRDRVASGLRLRFEARFDAPGRRLEGRLASFGRPLATPLHIYLAHPTLPARDLVLAARPDAQGRFAVALSALEATHWQVVVEPEARDWRLARSWSPGKDARLSITADAP